MVDETTGGLREWRQKMGILDILKDFRKQEPLQDVLWKTSLSSKPL